jgi:hypothetical protein
MNGEWEVENRGVAPDYDVELDPKALADGHDLQLERAVKAVLDQLARIRRRATSGRHIRTTTRGGIRPPGDLPAKAGSHRNRLQWLPPLGGRSAISLRWSS